MKSMHFSLSLLAALAFTFSLAARARAQTLTNLAIFDGANGNQPSTVIQATDGNFSV